MQICLFGFVENNQAHKAHFPAGWLTPSTIFSFWHSETINFQERFHFPNVRGFFTPSTDFLDKKRSVPTFIRMIQCPIKEVGRCGDKGGEDIMRLLPTTGYLSATLTQTQLYIFVYLALPVTELYTPLHIFVFISSIIII